jgi:hypothetical protein
VVPRGAANDDDIETRASQLSESWNGRKELGGAKSISAMNSIKRRIKTHKDTDNFHMSR